MPILRIPPLVLAALLGVTGCAGIQKPEQTNFISDYSKLEMIDDNHDRLFYNSGKLGNYSSFIVEPVVLLIEKEKMNISFTDEELQELRDYFFERLKQDLSEDDGYAVVDEPGPGVARVRFGITDVKKTIGVLNISLFTKLTGAGIGGASAEGEIVDAITGEQLAAVVRWGGGSRVLIAGLTKMGDAKIAINRWCRNLRTLLDEAHGL